MYAIVKVRLRLNLKVDLLLKAFNKKEKLKEILRYSILTVTFTTTYMLLLK
jgi:hypothetical protein